MLPPRGMPQLLERVGAGPGRGYLPFQVGRVGSSLNPRTPYLGPGNYEETLPSPSQPLWAQEVLAPWAGKHLLFAF